jgi:hypothetical protein
MEDNYKNWLRDTGNQILKYIFDIIPRGVMHFLKLFPSWFQLLVLFLVVYYIFLRK